MSPDACNLDTRSGALRSAAGFTRVMPELVQAERSLERMYVYTTEHGNRYLAAAQDVLYLYDEQAHLWRQLYQFANGVTGESMDFLKVRVGTADRLLIACGTEPMVAFDAETNLVAPFGSAEKLSNKYVSFAELYFGSLPVILNLIAEGTLNHALPLAMPAHISVEPTPVEKAPRAP